MFAIGCRFFAHSPISPFFNCGHRSFVTSSRFLERRVSPLIDQSTKHPFVIHLANTMVSNQCGRPLPQV
jgi:hypothetical protein